MTLPTKPRNSGALAVYRHSETGLSIVRDLKLFVTTGDEGAQSNAAPHAECDASYGAAAAMVGCQPLMLHFPAGEPGDYSLKVEVFDLFPGLSSEDQVLSFYTKALGRTGGGKTSVGIAALGTQSRLRWVLVS